MDKGAWQATVHRITKNLIQLIDLACTQTHNKIFKINIYLLNYQITILRGWGNEECIDDIKEINDTLAY